MSTQASNEKGVTSLKRTAARSLTWAVLEGGGLSGLLFVTTLILARWLGPAEFGLAALAFSLVTILNFCVLSLFHDAIVQRASLESDHLDAAFWTSLGLGVLLSTGCWLLADWIEDVFRQPGLGPVLAWMSLSLIFAGANSVHIAKLRRDANFKAIALRTLIGRSAGAAIGISMAFGGYGVWSLVTQQLASTIFATLLVWLSSSYRPVLRLSLPRLLELLRFGISVLAAAVTGEIGRRVFIVLVGYFCGATSVGLLSISIRFVETPVFILFSGISQIGLALFSKRQNNPEALRKGYAVAKEYCALVTLPVFVGLAVTADKIVPVVLGDQWTLAASVVPVAALGGVFIMFRAFNYAMFNALGRPRFNVLVSIFSLGIMLIGMALFGKYGVVAATIVWVSQQFVLFLELLFVRSLLNISVFQQIKMFFVQGIASLVMAICCIAIKVTIVAKLTELFTLVVLVPSGALIYLFMIYVLKRDLLRGFIIFLSDSFSKEGRLRVT